MASCAASSVTSVASSATVVDILAGNSGRRGVILFNGSTQILYLKFGSAATSSDYTTQIAAGTEWKMPDPVWVGTLTGLWASANGAVKVTELS